MSMSLSAPLQDCSTSLASRRLGEQHERRSIECLRTRREHRNRGHARQIRMATHRLCHPNAIRYSGQVIDSRLDRT
jgi:hypothetical protein